ncbi:MULTISPECIES: hypothetical protein [Cupriavidus]
MSESNLRPVPYPADTRAKGWRFELDLEQIDQSDTWALTPPDLRPWLLMLWASAWRQTPCGSLPDDDALIAVRIGMKPATFIKHRSMLMRGWWRAEDGRLYHDTVSKRVAEMLALRDKEKARKAEYRRKREAEESARKAAETTGDATSVPDLSHGTTNGQTQDSNGMDNTSTSTSTSTNNSSIPDGIEGESDDSPPPAVSPEEMTKMEIWHAGKAMLEAQKMPKAQCGSFIGKLCKDYGNDIVLSAVRAAAVERPVDVATYLVATCKHGAGQRARPNKQEALEANNRAVADRLAAKLAGAAQ